MKHSMIPGKTAVGRQGQSDAPAVVRSTYTAEKGVKKRVLMLASVASMIDQFNMPNIRMLLNMGMEVHVACNFREGNTCDAFRLQKLKKQLQNLEVAQHQWDCPRSICMTAWSIENCRKAFRQLMELTGKYRFIWIHCHSPVGGALARLAAKKRGIRVIYTAHGFHFYKGAPVKNWLLYYPVEKVLAHWTDVLVTVNQEDYCLAKRRLQSGRVYYIPGIGIDTGTQSGMQKAGRKECRRKYQIPEEAFLLLSVGELSRRKNHQAVIQALAELDRTDVYYLICGQGALKEELMQQAAALGVAERIRMPGFQENVAYFYQSADLFVFPSLQEGLPVALMEAMAAGLACVVSDIRGNRELVGSQQGWESGGILFLPKQDGQLKDALEKLLGNQELREAYGKRNREKVKQYDQAAVCTRMHRIYSYCSSLECV